MTKCKKILSFVEKSDNSTSFDPTQSLLDIEQISHHGIAHKDALGCQAQMIVGCVYELSSVDIGLGAT